MNLPVNDITNPETISNPNYNPNYGGPSNDDLYPYGTDLCISNCNEDDDLDVDNDGS